MKREKKNNLRSRSNRGGDFLIKHSDMENPVHIGFIMDGNGRWAKKRGLPRIEGHRKGVEAVHRVVMACQKFGIRYITVYAFSTENWSRPPEEVRFIMKLFEVKMLEYLDEMKEKGVRVRIMGRSEGVSPGTLKCFKKAEQETSENTVIDLIIALNYGGRAEIVDACRKIAGKVAEGVIKPEEISEEMISGNLYLDIPEPDLIVRSSGETRLSNFLTWESVYSELFVTDVLWPDITEDEVAEAIAYYRGRKRKFGGITDE